MKAFVVVLLGGLLVVLAGCKGGDSGSASGDKLYDVRGTVTAVNPAKPSVRLDHEDIPGHMPAMEMTFDVQDAKLLDGIKVGDKVKGKIKKTDSGDIITQLEKL